MINDYTIATFVLLIVGFVLGTVFSRYRHMVLTMRIDRLEGMLTHVTNVLTEHTRTVSNEHGDIQQLLGHVDMMLQGYTKANKWGGNDPVKKPDDAIFYKEEDLKPVSQKGTGRRRRPRKRDKEAPVV